MHSAVALRRTLARTAFGARTMSSLRAASRPSQLATLARRRASSTTPYMTTADPAETEAHQALEKGTQALEDGDIESAKKHYGRAIEIQPTAGALFNFGVAAYHLRQLDEAIDAWTKSIELQPSADAHTNLASAYIISPTPQPELAIMHLKAALQLAPDDGEIQFNLAAVFEATGNLPESLKFYTRSRDNGVDKAVVHIRNVSTKIFGERLRDAEKTESKGQ
ncbi:TPR-like protein [Auriculariales sp. MPI-PUGE-AT-0066]|nr:TPR-like protein [Auriculariales sp. MPI-PUGE-AT-0066]